METYLHYIIMLRYASFSATNYMYERTCQTPFIQTCFVHLLSTYSYSFCLIRDVQPLHTYAEVVIEQSLPPLSIDQPVQYSVITTPQVHSPTQEPPKPWASSKPPPLPPPPPAPSDTTSLELKAEKHQLGECVFFLNKCIHLYSLVNQPLLFQVAHARVQPGWFTRLPSIHILTCTYVQCMVRMQFLLYIYSCFFCLIILYVSTPQTLIMMSFHEVLQWICMHVHV